MTKPSFVYTTYIQTTPERLWQALTEPAFTERYWRMTFETRLEGRVADDLDTVRRHGRRPRAGRARGRSRIAGSPTRWHTFTPELAEALGARRRTWRERIAAEPRSKVTFELEPLGELVKLTVVHDGSSRAASSATLVSQGLAARPLQPEDAPRDRRDLPQSPSLRFPPASA